MDAKNLINNAKAGRDLSGDGDDERTRDGRRKISVSNHERAARWLREEIGRGQLSGLFRRGSEIVFTPRVGEEGYVPPEGDDDDGPAQVRVVSALDFKTAVEVRYSPGVHEETKEAEDGGKAKRWRSRLLPSDVAAHVLSAARSGDGTPNLKILRGVTHTPVMRADGTVLDRPGYDSASRLLYLPDVGLTVPAVSDEPTEREVKDAVELIASIVEEFPFVSDDHRANWFGALFTPIMRSILPPPYPQIVIDAPSAGSGKGFLADIPRTVHGGILRSLPGEAEEWKKELLGILLDTTAPVVIFDNVRGVIKSAVWEAFLTSPTFSSRYLGHNREATVLNDRLWLVTGNNAQVGDDLARRTYWVTIDANMPRPQERTGFKLDLPTWVPANRGAIIHAMLTIARAWAVAGMPTPDRTRSDSYARWDAGMRGLLSWAGFPGQFGRPDPKHLESEDDQEWSAFLNGIFPAMGEEPFTASELVTKIAHDRPSANGLNRPDGGCEIDPLCLPGNLADKWAMTSFGRTSGFAKSLGRWMSNRANRFAGNGLKMRTAPGKDRTTFRIEQRGV